MTSQPFSKVLAELGTQSLYVINPSIPKIDYIPLDLSVSNEELQTVDVSSPDALETYINNHIKTHNGVVAYGGYLETRGIYRRSAYFNDANPDTERNIHLGLDLWIAANTPIYTPLDAEVHSFNNNTNFGDYGPTILLKHHINNIEFYTLYGHLSLASIENLRVGQTFQQGEQLATLGDASVNGDYAPHLHFQMIKDLQGYVGDYPGVCAKADLAFYQENCPDPNVLIALN
ncbi:peptidoglycan DD-metalloendopeptidase family protein [uncultured Psychroserpens sp.]|uniref:peptidoglycan DD-metalloendopeptidase family protein n=1 Tax=uncultured Psychroserpens sp. TaxID=255436 RepID=UPI002618DCE8|nr:peptidoglycan DD-metalloendopeptidase family protein [uncultured Psychroserpens sp.]